MPHFDWDEKPELNITPLVDIMLVLLAIMMVIAPSIVYEELIRLPKGSAAKQHVKKHPVNIYIDKDKAIKINKDKFEYNAFFDNFYQYAQSKLDSKSTVMIYADKRLDYGTVMEILRAVKVAGFTEVSLATDG